MNVMIVPSSIADIAAKVEAGARLTYDDGVRLYASRDIHELGRLANLVRERMHGDAAYYNVNRHINYTNFCVLRCKFCSFYRPYVKEREQGTGNGEQGKAESPKPKAQTGGELPAVYHQIHRFEDADDHNQETGMDSREAGARKDSRTSGAPIGDHGVAALPLLDASLKPQAASPSPDTYELSIEEIVARAREAYDAGATEVHIVGGLHPKLPFSYYLDMCRGIRAACPRMHIKAFTAIEIIHFTRISRPRLSIREVLEQLRAAGLGSLPGGGAEIFDDRVHEEVYQTKVGEEGWFDVHRTAHELGIYTNATMLYGHVERPEERIGHMIKLREHQDASLASRKAAFNCFIPLSFIPDGSALANLPGPTGFDDLRTLAVSRLMLDNIPHIKAFWIMQSAKLAQVSLNWGVDDVDGTVVYYDITKREGGSGNTHQELTPERIRRLIIEAGRVPVERDTLYRRVRRNGREWVVEDVRPFTSSRRPFPS